MIWIRLLPLMIFFLTNCHAGNKLTKPPNSNGWQIIPIPNSADKVGSIFAIKNRKSTLIADVDIKTKQSMAAIPYYASNNNLSFGIVGSFLGLKDSDTAQFMMNSAKTLNATFEINNGTLIRQDDDLKKAYEMQKQRIINNLQFYNLATADVYFVSEIIKSNKVNIKVKTSTESKADFSVFISKMFRLQPRITSLRDDSTAIVYELQEPLSVMFKLNKIKINATRSKDPRNEKDSIVDAILTDGIVIDPVIYKY